MKLESALRKPKRGVARDCLHEAQTEECFLSIFVGFCSLYAKLCSCITSLARNVYCVSIFFAYCVILELKALIRKKV